MASLSDALSYLAAAMLAPNDPVSFAFTHSPFWFEARTERWWKLNFCHQTVSAKMMMMAMTITIHPFTHFNIERIINSVNSAEAAKVVQIKTKLIVTHNSTLLDGIGLMLLDKKRIRWTKCCLIYFIKVHWSRRFVRCGIAFHLFIIIIAIAIIIHYSSSLQRNISTALVSIHFAKFEYRRTAKNPYTQSQSANMQWICWRNKCERIEFSCVRQKVASGLVHKQK